MTHHDDARFDDLIAQLGDGDSKDLFRELLERGMQQLIDAELTATIGAELHERTDTRTNQRNGGRERTLSTPAGDMNTNRPAPDEREWYDVPRLAELLGVSQEFIRQRTDRREIPFYKVGRLIRFGADDVAKWLDECRHDPMV